MCCGNMFYNPFTFIIMSLNVGDEVIVSGLDHEGNQHTDETVVIYQISGFSFLTTSGFGFGAGFMKDLKITGKKNVNPKPSDRALRVLAEIESRKLAEEAGFEPTGDFQNFPSEPE